MRIIQSTKVKNMLKNIIMNMLMKILRC